MRIHTEVTESSLHISLMLLFLDTPCFQGADAHFIQSFVMIYNAP